MPLTRKPPTNRLIRNLKKRLHARHGARGAGREDVVRDVARADLETQRAAAPGRRHGDHDVAGHGHVRDGAEPEMRDQRL